MAFSNMPPEVSKKLRLYFFIGGAIVLVVGCILAFVIGLEELQFAGYILMVWGPIEILIGLILFRPNNRI